MTVPGRKTAAAVTWLVSGLLADSDALPAGLAAALRAYGDGLRRQCAGQAWARAGQRTRYGVLADAIGQDIADGKWKPGERMPSARHLAAAYGEQEKTVDSALFVLALRGHLALHRLTYYVLPAL